ncbi:MAG: response regulator transcription factor [Candidatus Ancillula sp.]|jgi:DNA-binding response OmpR family regulator|nr:response regulator transcription factor [Candidatus Ancillula sp.]
MSKILCLTNCDFKAFNRRWNLSLNPELTVWEVEELSTLSLENSSNYDCVFVDCSDWVLTKILFDNLDRNSLKPPLLFLINLEYIDKCLEFNPDDFILSTATSTELKSRIKLLISKNTNSNNLTINKDSTQADRNNDKNTKIDFSNPLPYQKIVGNLRFNQSGFGILNANSAIDLTYREFQLFNLLVKNIEKTVTREQIIAHLWEGAEMENSRLIDVHIQRIRSKLGIYSRYIKSVRGLGYSFTQFP